MPEDVKKATKRLKVALWMLAIAAIALALFIHSKDIPPPNGKYDALAQCISASGAKFYGAFWCQHCHDQKNEFGDAAQYLPYVECSLPDASNETQACAERGIQHYPTWIFPDGSRLEGVVTVEELAKRTGCAVAN
jgi:hypothetical protein